MLHFDFLIDSCLHEDTIAELKCQKDNIYEVIWHNVSRNIKRCKQTCPVDLIDENADENNHQVYEHKQCASIHWYCICSLKFIEQLPNLCPCLETLEIYEI